MQLTTHQKNYKMQMVPGMISWLEKCIFINEISILNCFYPKLPIYRFIEYDFGSEHVLIEKQLDGAWY